MKMNEDEYTTRVKLYKKAINLWGEDLQYGMLCEECGELISALNHYRRGRVDRDDVLEEMADTIIMIKQILFMLELEEKDLEEMQIKKLNKMKSYIKEFEIDNGCVL